ncbi:reticulon-like protein B16, partial [Olea europaea var. sylvestris]|uniref:reticulon-like protein B16 n=1 Tax=Olea europaea var. sylvestris TaxID=158386 RepID=UPI000C1D7C30
IFIFIFLRISTPFHFLHHKWIGVNWEVLRSKFVLLLSYSSLLLGVLILSLCYLAADVIMWRWRHVSSGIIIVATVAWVLIERSGLSFLSLCSDILLSLIVLLFLQANYAVFRKRQLQTLPELVLSEEMVNNAAASFRVKVNYMLLMAHDITLGKDFRHFFLVSNCYLYKDQGKYKFFLDK